METLYSIDKKGKIRVFSAQVEEDTESPTCYIVTKTGLLEGKLIKKEVKITKGKQNRTIYEQAKFECESLLSEKIDEGYKSFDDLLNKHRELKNITTLSLYNEDDPNDIKALFHSIISQGGNTNSNKDWYPLPMLAEKWKTHKDKVKYPVLVQPKLNGVRALCFLNKEGKVTFMSRGGIYYIIPHLQDAMIKFFERFPTVIFDGEIFKEGMPLQDISGAIRSTELGVSLFSKQNQLEYWIYDVPSNLSQRQRESQRVIMLANLFMHTETANKFISVYSEVCNCEEDVLRWHGIFVAKGFEGAIVRDLDTFYQFGFRDSCLLKVKEFLDEEFIIEGCSADDTNGEDTLGESFVFILRNNTNDLTFKARPTGTLKQKLYWYHNIQDYISKKATVRFQERSKDGLPIQGHVRHQQTEVLIETIRDYE